MTKLDVIEYHLKKEKYFIRLNNQMRSIDNNLKMGEYKENYDKAVLRYRKELKLHREAIKVLEGLKWNLENLKLVRLM